MRVRPSFIDSGEDFAGSECNEDQAVSSPQPESKGKKVKGNNWTPREKMVLMNEVMKGGGGKVSHLVFAPPPFSDHHFSCNIISFSVLQDHCRLQGHPRPQANCVGSGCHQRQPYNRQGDECQPSQGDLQEGAGFKEVDI